MTENIMDSGSIMSNHTRLESKVSHTKSIIAQRGASCNIIVLPYISDYSNINNIHILLRLHGTGTSILGS